jgi:hypothetical protein
MRRQSDSIFLVPHHPEGDHMKRRKRVIRKAQHAPEGSKFLAHEQRDATRSLRKWQKILRLQDWDISLEFGRWHEIHEESHAHCHYSRSRREAHIMLRHPNDRREDVWAGDNCVELSVIHELMHLKLSGFETTKAIEEEAEATTEQLARVLFLLDRGQWKQSGTMCQWVQNKKGK